MFKMKTIVTVVATTLLAASTAMAQYSERNIKMSNGVNAALAQLVKTWPPLFGTIICRSSATFTNGRPSDVALLTALRPITRAGWLVVRTM